MPFPPPESLAISLATTKLQAIATPFAIFRRKNRPHCGLAGDGDVCNRTSRRFATAAIFGALSSDSEKGFAEGLCRRFSELSQKGSQKVSFFVGWSGLFQGRTLKVFSEGVQRRGLSRRCLERPVGKYDPSGVRTKNLQLRQTCDAAFFRGAESNEIPW